VALHHLYITGASISERLKADMKEAMKAKDQVMLINVE